MYKIKCYDRIARCGLNCFGADYEITDNASDADAALIRSSVLSSDNFSDKLMAIARAGAGVNNIPVAECTKKGVVVFNTPGANANAVKELVVAALLISSRDIIGGVNWVKTLDSDVAKSVEKGKKAFAGKEIFGKKLGVIGLGAIGVLVANAALSMGMTVYGYDPMLSVEHALALKTTIHIVKTADEIYSDCDYITVHVPLLDSTKGMIDRAAFSKMKKGAILLNFSRDLLVNEDDLADALDSGKVGKYLTDFPNEKIIALKNVVCIPHLGASTEESEDNCAVMAVNELKDYAETGSIKNSVNFPAVEAGCFTDYRITVLHKNVPNMISKFTGVLGDAGINIENMINKSKNEEAYTVIDVSSDPSVVKDSLSAIENVFKVRVIAK